MKFEIITIFPDIFKSYFSESIISRAQKRNLIKINIHDLRDYANNKYHRVDDSPYGGGPGMVVRADVIYKAVNALTKLKRKNEKVKTILFSPKGKKFDQKMAQRFSKLDKLIMICGRYEGVDERVVRYIADEEVSIGDYVLTGGEIPAMTIVDAITRLIPGVIAKESLKEESFSFKKEKLLREENYEYPQYTRPESILINKKKRSVPPVLLSGDHKKIEEWRKKS